MEPTTITVKEDSQFKGGDTNFVSTKLMTRLTYTLDGVSRGIACVPPSVIDAACLDNGCTGASVGFAGGSSAAAAAAVEAVQTQISVQDAHFLDPISHPPLTHHHHPDDRQLQG